MLLLQIANYNNVTIRRVGQCDLKEDFAKKNENNNKRVDMKSNHSAHAVMLIIVSSYFHWLLLPSKFLSLSMDPEFAERDFT